MKKTEKITEYMLKEFDYTGAIANHYGFLPIISPKISKLEETQFKSIKSDEKPENKQEILERLAVLNFYHNSHFQNSNQPVLFYFKKPFPPERGGKKNLSCGLEILNNPKPLSEAIAIKTAFAILEDSGHKGLFIELNFIGDKESFNKFEKELSNYFRKNISDLPSTYRQKFKNNLYEILSCEDEAVKDFCHNAPKPINCLNEESRTHFKEILEFLDSFEVEYRINHSLIPNKNYASHFIFNIFETVQNKKTESYILLGYGGRYNNLAKKAGHKKDVANFGITINYKQKNNKKIYTHKLPKPKFYLVQIGNFAKMKVLNIIEKLRKEKIPVHHSLTKEKITMQITSAEYLKVSHLLIIGQKEAIDNSVVVRSTDSRTQETVSIKDLSAHLKKLK